MDTQSGACVAGLCTSPLSAPIRAASGSENRPSRSPPLAQGFSTAQVAGAHSTAAAADRLRVSVRSTLGAAPNRPEHRRSATRRFSWRRAKMADSAHDEESVRSPPIARANGRIGCGLGASSLVLTQPLREEALISSEYSPVKCAVHLFHSVGTTRFILCSPSFAHSARALRR